MYIKIFLFCNIKVTVWSQTSLSNLQYPTSHGSTLILKINQILNFRHASVHKLGFGETTLSIS